MPDDVAPPSGSASSEEQDDRTGVARSAASRMLHELSRLDLAVYQAIASTPTPTLDAPLRRVSNAANNSLIWVAAAGILAAVGGRRGRRAAVAGLSSVVISSATVNLGLKRLSARTRPDRVAAGVVGLRHTKMPESSSFPSGHSASGFAFATAVGHVIPVLSFPMRLAAAVVSYSRIHSGVHYPGDVVIGSLAGGTIGLVVAARVSSHVAVPS
jgi:undecaprenyl-diphosphatase